MARVAREILVKVPVRTAYNQWTQFESFPEFMEGVQEVRQVDDRKLWWRAKIAGNETVWEAEIQEQIPDEKIAWRSITGASNAGVVLFSPVDEQQTLVHLEVSYAPEGLGENIADALGFVERRVEGDLDRFKSFLEEQGEATGAWRGEIRESEGVPYPEGRRSLASNAPDGHESDEHQKRSVHEREMDERTTRGRSPEEPWTDESSPPPPPIAG